MHSRIILPTSALRFSLTGRLAARSNGTAETESCNDVVISIGTLLATLGTAVAALAGIVVSVVFIARRKVAFVVPLIASAAVVGLFLLGSWLVRLAVP